METVPITRQGQSIGILEICREGMYTLFRAKCEWTGQPLCLKISGESGARELGLLLPDGKGCATLTRRLAPGETDGFPEPILAAVAEERAQIPSCPPEVPDRPSETESCPVVCAPDPPAVQPREEEDDLWYACPDGCLTRFDGRRNWIAMPAEVAQVPPGAEKTMREIGGRTYWVFPE